MLVSLCGVELGRKCWDSPGAPSLAVAPSTQPLSVLHPGVEGLSLDVSSLVDIRDYVNKELALRIRTDIDSQGAFFTDLNGFQVMPQARGPETPWSTGLDSLLPASQAWR